MLSIRPVSVAVLLLWLGQGLGQSGESDIAHVDELWRTAIEHQSVELADIARDALDRYLEFHPDDQVAIALQRVMNEQRGSLAPRDPAEQVAERLREVTIPSIQFPEVTVPEAVQALSLLSEIPMVVSLDLQERFDHDGPFITTPHLSGLSVEQLLFAIAWMADAEGTSMGWKVRGGVVLVDEPSATDQGPRTIDWSAPQPIEHPADREALKRLASTSVRASFQEVATADAALWLSHSAETTILVHPALANRPIERLVAGPSPALDVLGQVCRDRVADYRIHYGLVVVSPASDD